MENKRCVTLPAKFVDFKSQDGSHAISFGYAKGKPPFIYLATKYCLLDEVTLTEQDIDNIIDILTQHRKEKPCP